MATKRAPTLGEADRLIAHQARLLKAPWIAAHYHRLAEQGREANWTLEDYLDAVLAVESNARALRCPLRPRPTDQRPHDAWWLY